MLKFLGSMPCDNSELQGDYLHNIYHCEGSIGEWSPVCIRPSPHPQTMSHHERRYQATKEDNYWLVRQDPIGVLHAELELGARLTTSNLKHLRLGKVVRHIAISNGLDSHETSHMMFLVLEHNQPNPLFRAPIGNSPKVTNELSLTDGLH
jgi:hypothetical protein